MEFVGLLSGKGEKALHYMNKTYGKQFGDSFKLKDMELAGFTSLADNFTMTSECFPECYIRVTRSKGRYTTNYMPCFYYQKYQEYMQRLIEDVLVDCKVLYNMYIFPSVVYDYKTTFEEFLHDNRSLKTLKVFVPDINNMDTKIEKILEILKEQSIYLGEITFEILSNYNDAKTFTHINDWCRYEEENYENINGFVIYSFDRDHTIRYKKEEHK